MILRSLGVTDFIDAEMSFKEGDAKNVSEGIDTIVSSFSD